MFVKSANCLFSPLNKTITGVGGWHVLVLVYFSSPGTAGVYIWTVCIGFSDILLSLLTFIFLWFSEALYSHTAVSHSCTVALYQDKYNTAALGFLFPDSTRRKGRVWGGKSENVFSGTGMKAVSLMKSFEDSLWSGVRGEVTAVSLTISDLRDWCSDHVSPRLVSLLLSVSFRRPC